MWGGSTKQQSSKGKGQKDRPISAGEGEREDTGMKKRGLKNGGEFGSFNVGRKAWDDFWGGIIN